MQTSSPYAYIVYQGQLGNTEVKDHLVVFALPPASEGSSDIMIVFNVACCCVRPGLAHQGDTMSTVELFGTLCACRGVFHGAVVVCGLLHP